MVVEVDGSMKPHSKERPQKTEEHGPWCENRYGLESSGADEVCDLEWWLFAK